MEFDDLSDDIAFKAEPRADKSAVAIRNNITQVESALTEFDKISAGLAELERLFPPDLVYATGTTKGMAEAVVHRAAWRDPRITVEKVRKMAKAPVLALGKDIDARAGWLTEQLRAGETPVDEQIKAEERRKADEKLARETAEFGRIQAIQDAIAEIHMDATIASGKSSAIIRVALLTLRAQTLDPIVFQEMLQQAEAAKNSAVAKLEVSLAAAQHREAEADKMAAERLELEELRRADAERRTKEAADRIEADRLERLRIDAERVTQAAERQRIVEAEAATRAEAKRQAEAAAELEAKIVAFNELMRKASAPPPAPEPLPAEAQAPAPVAEAPAEPLTFLTGIGEVATIDATPEVMPRVLNNLPPIKLGDIAARLGFTLPAAFVIDVLGIESVGTDKRAILFAASDWDDLCMSLMQHVEQARVAG